VDGLNMPPKTLSVKGTGFSPYIKEPRTMGFTGCGKTRCFLKE
jgi:hypothetical protein